MSIGSNKPAFRDRESLIPELCHNHHFPANPWLKPTLLPSISHCVRNLLHADELRLSINAFIGNTIGLDDHCWDITKPSVVTVATQNVEPLLSDTCRCSQFRIDDQVIWCVLLLKYIIAIIENRLNSSVADPWGNITVAFQHLEVTEKPNSIMANYETPQESKHANSERID